MDALFQAAAGGNQVGFKYLWKEKGEENCRLEWMKCAFEHSEI